MESLYYTAPPQRQFDELREKAIEIWSTYDDEYGYATEKINKVKELKNVSDNFMYMVAMFDLTNMAKLADKLSEETREAVRIRMEEGGNVEQLNPF